ncbi:MAG: hypothetical protein IJ766_06990 [Clostridia bacterium]|nr:hypothetical protein [Clostridia bacterium]
MSIAAILIEMAIFAVLFTVMVFVTTEKTMQHRFIIIRIVLVLLFARL